MEREDRAGQGPVGPEQGRNRLGEASSPYLLQHAGQPVHWREWGREAFDAAVGLDRPLFLSIGYSTCHWCHVMAHESFEDEEVARLLNEHFVPVKVDREERPDVDDLYMTACQAMSGVGGWPLTVVATPSGEPFFTATYLPRVGGGGRPGLIEVLKRLADVWDSRREEVRAGAARATEVLRRVSGGEPGEELGPAELETAYRGYERRFDEARGGFGPAPKFPSPHVLLFLLRYGQRSGERRSTTMALRTLDAMRKGGIFDQVGFGVHRYSTDARWLVPHFEKMLYDQALYALACLEATAASGEARFGRVAGEVLTYVLRDLRDPSGGFRSAEDADSEGGEGAFYTWTLDEVEEVLGEPDAGLARRAFGLQRRGNYADEAGGGFTGRNILHVAATPRELARTSGSGVEEVRERLERIRRRLFEVRSLRPRPALDDKVLADWNGLAVAALARAGPVLEEARYTDAAREAAGFVLDAMRDPGGRLLHRWRRGEAGIVATASDYAYLVWGLLELHHATLEGRWLEEALRLDDEMVARCWDGEEGGYFLAASDARDLLVRRKEAYDGAVPSANAVAAWNAARLARLTGDVSREARAAAVERAFGAGVRKSPGAHAGLLLAADFRLGPGAEIVVAGSRAAPSTGALLAEARRGYRPRDVLLLRPPGREGDEVARLAPFTREMAASGEGARAYVCREYACRAPVVDPAGLRRALEG